MDVKSDQYLKCVDCGDGFLWSASEQGFYEARRLEPPKRCKPCRAEKRRRYDEMEARQG